MTKIMPENKQQIRYQWIAPILNKRLSMGHVLAVSPFSERTLKYWLSRYKRHGYEGLRDQSTRPHSSPAKTKPEITERILAIRDTEKLGGKKIYWKLQKEGVGIGERTVNYVLKREGKTRVYRKKRQYIYKRTPITVPGQLVEIDIKYGIHFGFGKWWYQYTAIDLASRWRYLKAFENRENDYSILFLEDLIKRTEDLFLIKAVKTDNDSVFTNRITGYEKSTDPLNPRLHDFDLLCNRYHIAHYLIDPGKPTQNGHVERSHRSDNEYFYRYLERPTSMEEYNYKLRLWNAWYNDLPHCSLGGLSPNEYLKKVQNVFA